MPLFLSPSPLFLLYFNSLKLDSDLSHHRMQPALPPRPTYRIPRSLSFSCLFLRVECRSSFEHENGKARCGSAAALETNKGINNHHHQHHRRSGTSSTDTPPSPWPSLRRAGQFLVFSSEGLPFLKCAAALLARSTDLFVRETWRETRARGEKKNFRPLCCARASKSAVHDPKSYSPIFYHAICI